MSILFTIHLFWASTLNPEEQFFVCILMKTMTCEREDVLKLSEHSWLIQIFGNHWEDFLWVTTPLSPIHS